MSYLNPSAGDPQPFTTQILGFRADKASATLPATTNQTLFTIATGRILLLGLLGEVTTIIQAQACNAKVTSAPTTGTAVDICAVLDINGKEAGTLFGITGTFATAMVGANAGSTVFPATNVVIPIGVIRLNTSATNTGATKWTLWYVPLDDGATVS